MQDSESKPKEEQKGGGRCDGVSSLPCRRLWVVYRKDRENNAQEYTTDHAVVISTVVNANLFRARMFPGELLVGWWETVSSDSPQGV